MLLAQYICALVLAFVLVLGALVLDRALQLRMESVKSFRQLLRCGFMPSSEAYAHYSNRYRSDRLAAWILRTAVVILMLGWLACMFWLTNVVQYMGDGWKMLDCVFVICLVRLVPCFLLPLWSIAIVCAFVFVVYPWLYSAY